MEPPGTYVIRVYRQDRAGMDGTVESVVSGERLPFHNPEELWGALYDLLSPRRVTDHPTEEGNP